MAKILPGNLFVTLTRPLLVTLLGSCVSVCVQDPISGVSGMNHYLLPRLTSPAAGTRVPLAVRDLRYANVALPSLFEMALELGAHRKSIQIKVFGGASLFNMSSEIGAGNIAVAFRYLEAMGMPVAASDVGGTQPRKIILDGRTGLVQLKRLDANEHRTLVASEPALYG